MCPQTTPMATKSHLCGPKHTRVTTTASCLSSAYLCSYHNTQFLLSRPCLSKAHFCGPQPTHCSIPGDLSLPLKQLQHSLCPKPTPVAITHHWQHHSNPADTTALHVASIPQRPLRASLVVLSIHLKPTQHPGGL